MSLPGAALAALAALLLLAGAPARAQEVDAEKAGAIRELLEVLDVRAMMGAVAANAGQGMLPMGEKLVDGAANLTAEEKAKAKAELRARQPRILADLQRAFADPKFAAAMEKAMIRVYGKVFTTAEIRDITAFYRTPTGQKMQRSAPQLSQEAILASAGIVLPVMKELAERHTRELIEKK